MKILLVALNARYSHSNPAVFILKNNLQGVQATVKEFNINQSLEYILGEVYRAHAQVVGISCYIWNRREALTLANELKKVAPKSTIVLGGPEVTYTAPEVLANNPGVDFVLPGEGELTLPLFLAHLASKDWAQVPGLVYRTANGTISTTPTQLALNQPDLEQLTCPYTPEDLEQLQGKIVYYESSRGCPFRCGYCLSSAGQRLRFLPLERVKTELLQLVKSGVSLVKFVDRTFNCHRQRALAIWSFLIEETPPEAHFHFEIAADLLDDAALDLLAQAPPGKFQFEIGVQSTNPKVLAAIGRPDQTTAIAKNVRQLAELGNIHLHLDLIAGLPLETWASFTQSFDTVYQMQPHRIQLGFLKVLPGTAVAANASKWGLKHLTAVPYEILETPDLTYSQLWQLKRIEELVEIYGNTQRFSHTINYLVTTVYQESAFHFYQDFAEYWVATGLYQRQHKSTAYYDLLYQYLRQQGWATAPILNRLKLDFALFEPYADLPPWMPQLERAESRSFHHSLAQNQLFLQEMLPHLANAKGREIIKTTRLIQIRRANKKIWLLIDYSQRNPVTNHPKLIAIPPALLKNI